MGHPDHVAAGEAAMAAVFPAARDRLTFPELLEEGLEPHNVREVWVSDHQDPDNYVDVTDYIEVAAQALRQHETQVVEEDIEPHLKFGRRRTGERVGSQYGRGIQAFPLVLNPGFTEESRCWEQ